jgi:hypothetical protein
VIEKSLTFSGDAPTKAVGRIERGGPDLLSYVVP